MLGIIVLVKLWKPTCGPPHHTVQKNLSRSACRTQQGQLKYHEVLCCCPAIIYGTRLVDEQ